MTKTDITAKVSPGLPSTSSNHTNYSIKNIYKTYTAHDQTKRSLGLYIIIIIRHSTQRYRQQQPCSLLKVIQNFSSTQTDAVCVCVCVCACVRACVRACECVDLFVRRVYTFSALRLKTKNSTHFPFTYVNEKLHRTKWKYFYSFKSKSNHFAVSLLFLLMNDFFFLM